MSDEDGVVNGVGVVDATAAGAGSGAGAGAEPDEEAENEFFDSLEQVVAFSNDLNKFNLSKFRGKTFDLQPHEQTLYGLHLHHISDFCRIVQEVVNRSGPNPLPPPRSPGKQPAQAPATPEAPVSAPVDRGKGPAERSASGAGQSSISPEDLIPERKYRSGIDYSIKQEMDINVRRGDRLEMVMLMDDGLALGKNLETGATGTFSVKCLTNGTLMPENEAEDEPPAGQDVPAEVEPSIVPESAQAADDILHRSVSQRSKNGGDGNWAPVLLTNVLSRSIGRHVAIRTYQSGSVLEASLEVGDEVEVMFWEDEEMAVGIHVPTQTEALFRGSLLRFVGATVPVSATRSSSVPLPPIAEAAPVRVTPLPTGRMVEIPADIGFTERKESLNLNGGIAVNAAMVAGPSNSVVFVEGADETASQSTGYRRSILAQVVAAQHRDEMQYKNYLDGVVAGPATPQVTPLVPGMPVQPPPRGSSNRQFVNLYSGSGSSSPVQGTVPFGQQTPAQPSQPTAPMTEEQRKRATAAKYVIAELHETEESYMNLLKVFKERIIEPMREMRLLSTMDIDRAFKHLPPIYDLSVKVESYLRDAKIRDTGDAHLIVDLFLTNIEREEWLVYENYIKDYKPAKQIVSRMEAQQDARGEQFRAFCRRIEMDELCMRKNLDDFMMLPIQRITRYHLLLERLRKYCEPGSVTQESIGVAEGYMKEIGNTLQGVQAREDEMLKMFEIVNTVDNCPSSIVSYSKRRYVAEFTCVDLMGILPGFGLAPQLGGSVDNTGSWPGLSSLVTPGPGARLLYLFSDTILVAAFRNMSKIRPGAIVGVSAGGSGKKMELVQKLDLNKVTVVDERRSEAEDDADIILRLRPIGAMGPEDPVFMFRMNDSKSRKTIESVARSVLASRRS
ncbi:hypothetical protein DFJ73DRAFT_842184 [Zopfochytrium polystomum]|nr:hypothetical protein DFJ73DRAFT_842184 [Zopfochytrium polystomum]